MNPLLPTGPVKPGARARLLVYVTGAGLWISGGLWLIYHNFLRRPGEWGPEPNVLEPWWLKLHGAFAFLALWLGGLLWGVHIVRGWTSGRRRWTGSLLFAWLMALILSGYLLYYAGDDGPWGVVSPGHWIAGLALPVVYAIHHWMKRRPGG
jgi:hypothetical protein